MFEGTLQFAMHDQAPRRWFDLPHDWWTQRLNRIPSCQEDVQDGTQAVHSRVQTVGFSADS